MLGLFLNPILAELGELIGAIVPLLFIVIWVVQRIIEANKAIRGREPHPAMPEAAENAPGGAERPGGQQADSLRAQVEEFLRRAGQSEENQGAKGTPVPAAASRDTKLLVSSERGDSGRGSDQRDRTRASKSSSPGRRQTAGPRPRQSLAQSAEDRIGARARTIAQNASNLGQRIVTDDQQFDVQLKSKFDHTLGKLAANTVPASELTPVRESTPASQIAEMLANPDGVRQAIILNEVLRRPTERW